MRMRRVVGAAAAAALVAALAIPAAASPPSSYHEQYSFTGTIAQADWFSEEEPDVGEIGAVFVMGADATQVIRVAGSKPVRSPQPSVVALSMRVSDEEPGYAELWCLSEDADFVISDDLTEATLALECTGEFVVYNPDTGEEIPTGETLDLTVSASWTGVGELFRQKSHSRESFDGQWSMYRSRATVRDATAEVTITSPDATLFDGTMMWAQMLHVRDAGLFHATMR